MPKIPGARRFIVFTAPHAGDPKWETPVVELDDNDDPKKPAVPIEYRDGDVIEAVVNKLQRDRARSAGYNAGAQNVLTTFGLTPKDYYTRVKENDEKKKDIAEKNKLDKPDPKGVSSTNEPQKAV